MLLDKEKACRDALNAIGYVMPRVRSTAASGCRCPRLGWCMRRAPSEWPQGVGAEDPRDATAAYGKHCFQASVEVVRRLFSRAGLL